MHRTFLTIIATAALFLGATFAESGSGVESAQQGLSAVTELFRNGDWDALIRERCADARYAASAASMRELAQTLESQFADPAALAERLRFMDAALKTKPRFANDGSVAVFTVGSETMSLTRMDTGRWGIRL